MIRVKYLPLIIFPVAFWLFFAGDQRNGYMTAFLIWGALLMAPLIKDHWVRAFYLWCLIQTGLTMGLLFAHPVSRIFEAYRHNIDAMVKLSAGMIMYYWATKIKRTDFKCVFNILCTFILIECVIYGFQLLGIDLVKFCVSLLVDGRKRDIWPAGTLANKNFFAVMIAIILPLFFRKSWIWCLSVVIPVLISLNTMTAMAGISAGIIYYGLKTHKTYLLAGVAIGLVAFAGTIGLDDTGVTWRLNAWSQTLSIWKTWLILGVGPGTCDLWTGFEHTHNEYLSGLYEGGLIAGILIIGFLTTFLKSAYKETNKQMILIHSCLISFAVCCFGSYPLHLAPTAFVFLLFLGMYSNGRFLNV